MILEAAAAGDSYKVKLRSGGIEWRSEAQLRENEHDFAVLVDFEAALADEVQAADEADEAAAAE
eukprot:3491444-Prymnesium_polylepis.1